MSQLLAHWLNHEIQLSKRVEAASMNDDFKSGYLVAELLHSLHLLPAVSIFSKNCQSSDGYVRNYILLEPTLRALGVIFSSAFACELINGKQGTAAKLLYQIKIGHAKLLRTIVETIKVQYA